MSQPATDPWGTTTSQPTPSPWGTPETPTQDAASWLTDTTQPVSQDFNIETLFDSASIPLEKWVETALSWSVDHFRDFFQAVRLPIDVMLGSVESTLQGINPWIMILFFALFAWQVANKKLAIGTVVSLLFIGLIGAWSEAMVTLSLVITSVVFCILLGIPLGIWVSRSNRVAMVLKPILDAMQTTPAFVYLIPIVMLFGIGNVPGVVVTIIFALPPLIRLTDLGIRQVPEDLIEAGHSFGASPMQMLFRIQLPVAMPTIMAGINQTLMLALSMVVIASMIAVGGLGQMVLRGIGRLDMGLAAVGGIGIVLLAIILDRLTQAMGQKDPHIRHWYHKGPIGLIIKKFITKGEK